MNIFRFRTNNGSIMELTQCDYDRYVVVEGLEPFYIPANDMVMLINLYKHLKENDIQNDFVNPHGKNTDER